MATTATNKSNNARMIAPVYLKRNMKVFLGKPEQKRFPSNYSAVHTLVIRNLFASHLVPKTSKGNKNALNKQRI